MRLYTKLTGVKFSDSKYTWDETDYTGILLKSDTSVPDSVTVTSPWSSDVTGTGSGTKSYTFMSPDVFDVAMAIDGTIVGNIKFYAQAASTGSGYGKITKAELLLSKVDSDGNETSILSDTIWSGTLQANLGQTAALGVMFWRSTSGVSLAYNERLKLTITITYETNDPNNQGRTVGIYCSADDEETSITIPFIMG